MVCGSSTSVGPLMKAKVTMRVKAKKVKPTSAMKTAPITAIKFNDNHYRVSMLKSRFASTIMKAQQQLSESGRRNGIVEKKPQTLASTPNMMEETREVIREALWRKTEPPTTPTTSSNEEVREVVKRALWRKKRSPPTTPIPTSTEEVRKAARKAAREALEELERSVDVQDSHKSMKELERLCGWPVSYVGGFENTTDSNEELREVVQRPSCNTPIPTSKLPPTTPIPTSKLPPTTPIPISKLPPTTPIPTSTEEIRKAARKALEELERSVDVEDNHKSVKELERLCGWPIPYVGGFKNRMEYYGLYLKNY